MAKDIIHYVHAGHTVCVRRYWNRTELLFDDRAVDVKKGVLETSYALQGNLGEDYIAADVRMKTVGALVRLIINGTVVEQAWKA